MRFNVENITKECINWIVEIFEKYPCNGFVIDMSDINNAIVVGSLLCKSIGAENVFGMIMPYSTDNNDEDLAIAACEHLNIPYAVIDISGLYNVYQGAIHKVVEDANINFEDSMPYRLRMTLLYGLAQAKDYWVVGSQNQSDRFIGWSIKHGDIACDINPVYNLTKSEVEAIGKYLEIPDDFVKSKETVLGYSYDEIDHYIRGHGKLDIINQEIFLEISRKYLENRHKSLPPLNYEGKNLYEQT